MVTRRSESRKEEGWFWCVDVVDTEKEECVRRTRRCEGRKGLRRGGKASAIDDDDDDDDDEEDDDDDELQNEGASATYLGVFKVFWC